MPITRYIVFVKLDVEKGVLVNRFGSYDSRTKRGLIDVRPCLGFQEVDLALDREDEIKDYFRENLLFYETLEKLGEGKSISELLDEWRFWDVHEVLEDLWRSETDPVKKDVIHSIILLAVSLLNFLKGKEEVSDNLLSKSLSLISKLPEQGLPLRDVVFTLNSKRRVTVNDP